MPSRELHIIRRVRPSRLTLKTLPLADYRSGRSSKVSPIDQLVRSNMRLRHSHLAAIIPGLRQRGSWAGGPVGMGSPWESTWDQHSSR